ncbi:hypothetical protein [Rhizobium terrae]|uniref:hypothetical protein n=1 Tax=Rhizobium terrae TaxID=2171756 RepID=UPI0013C35049|nr:hypothetical protein [Rhizobium terrae]
MYENVVTILMSAHFRKKSEYCGLGAEDDFYQRFAQPFPRWLGRIIGWTRKRRPDGAGHLPAPVASLSNGPEILTRPRERPDRSAASMRNCCTS